MKYPIRSIGLACALSVGGSLLAAPVVAQDSGVIKGVVVNYDSQPLDQASVEIFGAKLTRTTNAAGEFRFEGLDGGSYWLRVRRIGHAPLTFSITLPKGGERDLRVELMPVAYELPEISVSGGMTNRRFEEFRWRRRAGWGRFFTSDEMARMRAVELVDVVQRGLPMHSRFVLEQAGGFAHDHDQSFTYMGFPGVSSGGSQAVGSLSGGSLYRRRSFVGTSSNCAPGVSINGNTAMPGIPLRNIRLDDVEAVEVYRARWVPDQMRTPQTTCGLVVVWLK